MCIVLLVAGGEKYFNIIGKSRRKVMSVSAILFLIFVFLKQLYIFPSGGLGVGDAVLAAAFLSALIHRLKKGRHGLLYREDYFFYAFLAGVFLVNGWYYMLSPHNDFIRNTAYWFYGCME